MSTSRTSFPAMPAREGGQGEGTGAADNRSGSPNLSLYSIETELLDLLRYREAIAADTEMLPSDIALSLEAADAQISAYVERHVRKDDGIAAYFRECETRAEELKAEAQRMRLMAAMWEQRHDRLEAITLNVMQLTGATLLEGAHSVFKIRKNPPSVEVTQVNDVPREYLRLGVKMTVALWTRLMLHLKQTDAGIAAELLQNAPSEPEPMKDAIKCELKAGVPVAGCKLIEDKKRLVVE